MLTLSGSVGVIISTILIRWTGYTVFDPIASLFIAALIVASVIPLVIDTGKVLCLDVGSHHEKDIRSALSEVRSPKLSITDISFRALKDYKAMVSCRFNRADQKVHHDFGQSQKANSLVVYTSTSLLQLRITTLHEAYTTHSTRHRNTVLPSTPTPTKLLLALKRFCVGGSQLLLSLWCRLKASMSDFVLA